MTEQPYRGEPTDWAYLESPEFRASMRGTGVSVAEAAERLHAAAQHFDLAEFEAQIAAHRPELWKRMNKQPSQLRGTLRRLMGRKR